MAMWITKQNGAELEFKTYNILHQFFTPLIPLFGLLVAFSSVQSGQVAGFLTGLSLAAIGASWISVPYEKIALFDKVRGKLVFTQKATLSRKESNYSLADMAGIRVVHVKCGKGSHDELRLLFKDGKEITVMGGAWKLETKDNATELAYFLNLPLEELEVSNDVFDQLEQRIRSWANTLFKGR